MSEIIYCPLLEKMIERYEECYFITMVADGLMPKNELPDGFAETTNWKEVCISCSNHLE